MLMGHSKSRGRMGAVVTHLGDTPATCYYWTQDKNGQVVCGNIGGGPALIQNPTNNPDLAQITIDEMAGQVGQYASMYAGLMGAFKDGHGNVYAPDSNNVYARCAQDYFRKLISTTDVFASDSTARLNRAANAAVKYVMYGCGSTLPGVQPGQFNQTIAAQLTPNAYGPFLYCDDRSPAGKRDCQILQQVATSGDFNFVSLIAGTGTPVDNPLHNTPPVQVNPSVNDWYAEFIKNNPGATVSGGPSGGMTPAPIATPVQSSSPVSQSYYATAPATTTLTTYDPEAGMVAPNTPAARLVANNGSNVTNTSVSTSSVSPVDNSSASSSPSVMSTLMTQGGAQNSVAAPTGTTQAGVMDWISANPLLAAGIAAGAFMLFSRR